MPVVPATMGSPVQLVRVPLEGVPKTGVVRVGDVRVLFVRVWESLIPTTALVVPWADVRAACVVRLVAPLFNCVWIADVTPSRYPNSVLLTAPAPILVALMEAPVC